MKYSIGDKITTKKSHPCGGNIWEIIRIGADIKIKCVTCGHIIMIDYDKFPKIIKSYIKVNGDDNELKQINQ